MKLIQLAITAALVTSFSALLAQTAPSPLQKPQSNSLPPPNKSASSAPVAPKASQQSYVNGRQSSRPSTGGVGNDQLYGGYGADVSRGDVGKDVLQGDRAIKATPAAPPKSPPAAPNTIYGGSGRDTVTGKPGEDFVHGGRSDTKITPAAPPKSQTGQQPGKR